VGAIIGAVGDDELAQAIFREMARGQFDGFAGANQYGGLLAEVLENPFGQPDGGKGDGNRAAADGGIGSYLLRRGKGMLKQLAQRLAQGAGCGGGLEGGFHLPQDLGFAQHHRIQAGSDPKHVADGGSIPVGVEIGLEVRRVQPLLARDPVDQPVPSLDTHATVEFRAIAGG